jgi:hypothetical protein
MLAISNMLGVWQLRINGVLLHVDPVRRAATQLWGWAGGNLIVISVAIGLVLVGLVSIYV